MRVVPRPNHHDVVRPRTSPEVVRTLIDHLTPRDLRIMRHVWRLRVLTTHQIARIEFDSVQRAKSRLLRLYRMRALDRFRPWTGYGSSPFHYILDTPGAQILAAEHDQSLKEFGYQRERVLSVAYRASLAHTLGINGFVIDLLAHTRTDPDTNLRWRTTGECHRQWGDLVRPDAAGRWTAGPRSLDWFLEYDTGTESLGRLRAKLDAYHELARLTGVRGAVLFYLPNTARESHLHHQIPQARVPAATAVQGAHPAHRVWSPLQHGVEHQHYLVDLGDHANQHSFFLGEDVG